MSTKAIPAPDSWRMTRHTAPSGKVLHIKVESKDRVIFDGFAGDEHHAKLAAASPDLLHALQRLTRAMDDYDGDIPADLNSPYHQARAAIAKATAE